MEDMVIYIPHYRDSSITGVKINPKIKQNISCPLLFQKIISKKQDSHKKICSLYCKKRKKSESQVEPLNVEKEFQKYKCKFWESPG